jgi:hypothetical protein
MKLPTLAQLERALHLRGAIEALQAELAAVLNGLADAVAPEPHETHEREPKGPFADAPEGARERRLREKQQRSQSKKKRRAPRRPADRKPPEESPRKNRLWSLLSGGEVGTAPVAAEPKRKRRPPKRSRPRRRKTTAKRRRKPPGRKAHA